MPKICYVDKTFTKEHEEIIALANSICDEYSEQGYTLTLRQLYYQFVARDRLANSQKEYKRLGDIVSQARLAGRIDWEMIEDRTRGLEQLGTWDSPKDIITAVSKQFRYDLWDTQPVRFEIWVEKEALVGVIERIAHRHRIPYLACRGYTSQSEAWRAGTRLAQFADAQPVKVLHLGDHDPSGIDMTRDNRERLGLFSYDADIEVIRVALNEDQVAQYNPPPNPAKLSDSRAESYVRRFGDESWELDALTPDIIDQLVTGHIEEYRDDDAWEAAVEREERARKRIAEVAKRWKDDE